MSELILHIGHGKTGTSAIQSFLALNQKKMEELGVHYPSHPSLSNAALGRISSGNGVDLKKNDLPLRLTEKATLYSSESLFHRLYEEPEKLNELIKTAKHTKVILYSRNLLDFAYSEWGQAVKRGGMTVPFKEFISKYTATHHVRALWWLEAAKTYNFEIVFRNYSNHSKTIIETFCSDLFSNDSWLGMLSMPSQSVVNRSLTDVEYEFQRVANKITRGESSSFHISDRLCNELPNIKASKPFIDANLFDELAEVHSSLLNKINASVPEGEKIIFGDKEKSTKAISSFNSLEAAQFEIITEGLMKCAEIAPRKQIGEIAPKRQITVSSKKKLILKKNSKIAFFIFSIILIYFLYLNYFALTHGLFEFY